MWSEVTLPAGGGAGLPPAPSRPVPGMGWMPLQGGKKNTIHQLASAKQFLKIFFCFMWEIGINLILCCILYLSCV